MIYVYVYINICIYIYIYTNTQIRRGLEGLGLGAEALTRGYESKLEMIFICFVVGKAPGFRGLQFRGLRV